MNDTEQHSAAKKRTVLIVAGFAAFLTPFLGSAVNLALPSKYQPRLVAATGMAVTMASLVALLTLGMDTSLLYISIIMAVIGTGFAHFSSPNTHAIMSSVGRKHYKLASGMVGTMRTAFTIFSVLCALGIFASAARGLERRPARDKNRYMNNPKLH
jgi:hypothetical protein